MRRFQDSDAGLLSRAAQRVMARNEAAKFFRTPALPSTWQGSVRGVRTIMVPAGSIGMRLTPREEDVLVDGRADRISLGAVVKGFVGVPAATDSPNHASNGGKGVDPSPVERAGIAQGMELLGIDDVRVDSMPYNDIMGELRGRATEPKELHFREPLERADYFVGAVAAVREAAREKGYHEATGGGGDSVGCGNGVGPGLGRGRSNSDTVCSGAAGGGRAGSNCGDRSDAGSGGEQDLVKAGTVVEVVAPAGELGMALQPARKGRGTGAVVWKFVGVLALYPGGVKEYVQSPVETAGVSPGMQLVAVDGSRTDDMLYDRVLGLLADNQDQVRRLTFKATQALRRTASNAAAAIAGASSGSDDEGDLPVARSRKRRAVPSSKAANAGVGSSARAAGTAVVVGSGARDALGRNAWGSEAHGGGGADTCVWREQDESLEGANLVQATAGGSGSGTGKDNEGSSGS